MELNTFEKRLSDGLMGEACVLRALELNIIPNTGYGQGPMVTESRWNDLKREQIMQNKTEGDVWFVAPWDNRKKYVDVKNTEWIAEDSLTHFRTEDSYYFINAFCDLRDNKYFMVRMDEDFKEYALGLPVTMSMNDKPGRVISFDDLPAIEYNSGNHRLVDFDPVAYKKVVRESFEYNRENNIAYKKRIW